MGGMLHQENLSRGRVAMIGCNWICNVVVFNENPSSTTLANFVGSVLSHSLNTAYTAHLVRLNFGYAETSYMLGSLTR